MFPLKTNKIGGYEFGEKTFYSAHHLGTDYSANYDTLYAPFDGEIVRTLNGKQGGLTIWFKYKDYIIRFLHLSKIRCEIGEKVKEGYIIGITGNTGSLTKAPHLHLDISKNNVQLNNFNNFINPETFNWETNNMKQEENFRKIFKYVKTLLEKDFGDNPNDNETKEIKDDLEDIKKTYKLLSAQNTELRKTITSFDMEMESASVKIGLQEQTIGDLKDQMKDRTDYIGILEKTNDGLREDIKSKEGLVEKNAESTKVYDAILFVIQTIKNRLNKIK